MLFSSLFFLYFFLPLCLIVYQIPRSLRGKNAVLLVFSLVFYAWGEPVWILQMLASGLVVWLAGLALDKAKTKGKKKLALVFGVLLALAPLILFKYSGFIIENIEFFSKTEVPFPNLKMPIGISFYTFQIISYIVDLYREECKVQKNPFDFLLYEALFPQLIAGPIVRYTDIEEELRNRKTSSQDLANGAIRFLVGLAKKTIIANYAGSLVKQTIESRLGQLSGVEALIGILAFTLQIYFDFSAYSDMAIGLGRMFGFHFKENFNYPYFSRSITDFWRRWHISMGSFFRDYVYIPLGGKYKHQYRNMLIVWFLTGLWHGASWNFVLWGLYFLVFLVIEKLFMGKLLEKIPRFICWIPISVIIVVGWAIFYFTNLNDLVIFSQRVTTLAGNAFLSFEGKVLLQQNIIFFIVAWLFSQPILPGIQGLFKDEQKIRWKASTLYPISQYIIMLGLLLISTAALAASSYNPFLYFRF